MTDPDSRALLCVSVCALLFLVPAVWTPTTNPVRQLTPPAIKRLSEVKCPALVILGEQDLPHIKEVAGLLVNGIAGARLVTIPRAGHMVNLDARDAFNQAVELFLSGR